MADVPAADGGAADRQAPPVRRRLLALTGGTCLILAALLGLLAFDERRSALAEAAARAQLLSRTLADRAADRFDALDTSLRLVADLLTASGLTVSGTPSGRAPARQPEEIRPEEIRPEEIRPEEIRPEEIRPEEIRAFLDRHRLLMPDVLTLSYGTGDGTETVTAGTTGGEASSPTPWEHLKAHRGGEAGLRIGTAPPAAAASADPAPADPVPADPVPADPVRATPSPGTPVSETPVSGAPVLASRRVNAADGTFAGVLWAALDPAALRAGADEAASFSGLRAYLLSDAGIVLASLGAPSEAADGPPGIAGPLVARARAGHWPVRVLVVSDEDAVIAAWWRRTAMLAAAFLPALCGIGLLCLFALRAVGREQATRTRLDDAEAALRQRDREVRAAEDRIERQQAEFARLTEGYAAARDAAQAATRAKSDFLANMSHELRTPLNAIIGFSEVLHEQMFGPLGHPRYREYAADIHASGTQLLGLIGDVLDLSKIEAGRLELQCELLNPAEVVDAVLPIILMRRGAPASPDGPAVVIENRLPANLPPLRADGRAAKQMLLNLLSNAVKFTPPGGHIRITGEGSPTGVRLTVSDDGIGIPPREIDKVLLPFEQGSNVAGGRYGGTGLGLTLVKVLIEEHGGRLTLESRLGEGTSASLFFPAGETTCKAA